MVVMAKFVCCGCRWWHFHPTEDAAEADVEGAVGYCRRFPPTRRENGVGAWPITFGSDWCGEYAEKSNISQQRLHGAAAPS